MYLHFPNFGFLNKQWQTTAHSIKPMLGTCHKEVNYHWFSRDSWRPMGTQQLWGHSVKCLGLTAGFSITHLTTSLCSLFFHSTPHCFVSFAQVFENACYAHFIMLIEQRHCDSLHWKCHIQKSFLQNNVHFTSCFVAREHGRPGKYFHIAIFCSFISKCTICARRTTFPIPLHGGSAYITLYWTRL